jgi:hypothetical protein
LIGYEDTTEVGLLARTDPFEKAVATLLGLALFAQARLDLHLGLLLASASSSRPAELAAVPFGSKLEQLQSCVDRLAEAEAREAYSAWIASTRGSRLLLGDLVEGRWVPDARSGGLVNVVTLPTGEQERVVYSQADLEEAVDHFAELFGELARLRREWPLAN